MALDAKTAAFLERGQTAVLMPKWKIPPPNSIRVKMYSYGWLQHLERTKDGKVSLRDLVESSNPSGKTGILALMDRNLQQQKRQASPSPSLPSEASPQPCDEAGGRFKVVGYESITRLWERFLAVWDMVRQHRRIIGSYMLGT
jgi:hypothetical protein